MRGTKVLIVLVALLSAVVVRAEETSREVSADDASDNGKDPAGLEVAARQPLFDYAGSIGLRLLEERLEDGDIHIPHVHKRVDVPVIGGVDVDVKDIKCKRVEIPDNLTSIQIADGYYHLMSTEVYLEADFKWGWHKGPLSSSGSGALLLKNGVIDLLFTVGSSPGGHPMVRVGAVSVSFSDIDLHLQSKHLTWLYSVLLTLFHDQIAGAITDQINNSLEWDVPNLVNKILHTVPTNVKINNLPFAATFQYALYTQRFVLGEGFIDVSTTAPRDSRAAAAGGKCPFHATALALSNDAILKEGQMVTLYLHQSVANCILWALFNAGRLELSVKDGTIPSIRLITDLFVSLIPGIEKQYPRRPMRIDINATAPPMLVFDGKLRHEVFNVQYDSKVYVVDQPLTEGEAARGEEPAHSSLLRGRGCRNAAGCAAPQLAAAERRRLLSEEVGREAPAAATGGGGGAPKEILVAHLHTNLTIAAQLRWDLTLIRSIDVQYQVVDSPFKVPVSAWDSTVKFVVETLGPQLGLKKLKEQYLNLPVVSDIRLAKPDVQVLDEWLGFSFDLRLHGNLSHPHPRPVAPLGAQ